MSDVKCCSYNRPHVFIALVLSTVSLDRDSKRAAVRRIPHKTQSHYQKLWSSGFFKDTRGCASRDQHKHTHGNRCPPKSFEESNSSELDVCMYIWAIFCQPLWSFHHNRALFKKKKFTAASTQRKLCVQNCKWWTLHLRTNLLWQFCGVVHS